MGFNVGLALGGGAARGYAHIGVLKALEDYGVPVHIVSGTSIGSLVGGLYSAFSNADAVKKKIAEYIEGDVFQKRRFDFLKERDKVEENGFLLSLSNLVKKGIFYSSSFTRVSFVSEEDYLRDIEAVVGDLRIEDLRLPFASVALDISLGEEVVARKGLLRDAISSSCAIPGMFPPIEVGGKILVDGGWVNTVPIQPAIEMGADFVIGVDVAKDLEDTAEFKRGLNVIFRTNAVTRNKLKELQLKEADVVIRPPVDGIHWADFSQLDQCFQLGYQETMKMILEIRHLLRRKQWKRRFLSPWKRAAR